MTVRHETMSHVGGDLVQVAAAAENWAITAYWLTADDDPYCRCEEQSAAVTADVSWNQSTGRWSVTCLGCDSTNGPIYAVNICQGTTCSTGAPAVYHAHSYKLIVNADLTKTQNCPPGGNRTLHLDRVMYATSAVSNGNLVNMGDCSLSTAVTPIYASYTNNDGGAFECPFNCSQNGPEILISYH
jgi:hypothetical protein